MARPAIAPIVCACLATLLLGLAPGAAAQLATQPAIPTTQPLPTLANTSVSIPWNELLHLIDRGRGELADRPPVDFVFSPAAYTAQVTEKSARITAEVDITLLTDGYALVPLGPADAGVLSVSAGADPAPIVLRDRSLFTLLSGKGKKHLTLTLERPVQSDAGAARLDVPLIPSPLVTLTANLPMAGLDARATGAASVQVKEAGNVTTVVASYPGGATAALSWRRRPADAKQEPRVYAETETLATVERSLLRTRARIRVQAERSPVQQVKLAVDPASVVLSVTGKGVAAWAEAVAKGADGKDAKTVTVDFAERIEDERTIEVLLERDLPEEGGPLAIGPVTVGGAKRDRGVIALETRGGYDVRPGESNMERLSVSELPSSLRELAKGSLQVAYRYAGPPASAAIVLERVKPQAARVFALTQTRVAVDRGILRCRAAVTYEILHAGVDVLRITLPAGVEFIGATGEGVRGTQVIEERGGRTLVVGLKDLAKGAYALNVDYDFHFDEQTAVAGPATQPATRATRPATGAAMASTLVPLISHPDAAQDRGFVGIEVRGGYELTPSAEGAERVDVKELPQLLWGLARSPLLLGYRYDATAKPRVGLSLTRHRDADVLVAMSDVCEASTTITSDGKSVTKMMFVVRNNLKPFMTLRLPAGAQVWSTFVDDRPVTPSLGADGALLVPLKKSDDVDEDDEESYRGRREKRRKEGDGDELRKMQQAQKVREPDDAARDLKPYDVEVVFVMPPVKLPERGELSAALPQCDVPIGHLSWAVFLPKNLRVSYAEGNVAEVQRFTLPFRHFGEAQFLRQEKAAAMAKAQQKLEELAKAQDAMQKLAEAAKAQGVLPVRIEIPIVGQIQRFEKFLTVDEMPTVTIGFRKNAE